jgi:hypothetical protein
MRRCGWRCSPTWVRSRLVVVNGLRLLRGQGVRGWALPRCAGPGCRAPHRVPILRPVSRPCRASIPSAQTRPGRLRRHSSRRRPIPWPGITAQMSVAGTRPTVPLDELARRSRTALRFTALRSGFVCCARARSSPRPPATPGAGPPEDPNTWGWLGPARPPRQSLRLVARRSQSRRSSRSSAGSSRSLCARSTCHTGRSCSGPP